MDSHSIKQQVDALIEEMGSLLDMTQPIGTVLNGSTGLKIRTSEIIRNIRELLDNAEDEVIARKRLVESAKRDHENAVQDAKKIKTQLKNAMDLEKTFVSSISDRKKLQEVVGGI